MSAISSYKRLAGLVQNESFEPMLSWGLRMAISGTAPIIWGVATGHISEATWITLTAEAISWVELKGSFAWRVRTLVSAAVLAVFFSLLGTLTAHNVWLSVAGMFAVGFVATLLKNMGDRASGLAISVYLMYIICNAYPVGDLADMQHRMWLIAIGAAWPVAAGMFISLLTPAEEPFRRQIALIWRSVSDLAAILQANGTVKDIYTRERNIRTAIDNSYQFYGRMAHQQDEKDHQKYQLALIRKTAGIVGANVIAIAEETEHIAIDQLDRSYRLKAATLLGAMKGAIHRLSVFTITLKPEEKLLAVSHINRMRTLITLLRQFPLQVDAKQAAAIARILQLCERNTRFMENAILRLEQMGADRPVFRSYSLVKTSLLLKPRHFYSDIRALFDFNALTTRYAIRSAIAASVALFAYKWFNIDHGYWMPFSVMIVIQPYFGATFKKAIDRVAGTLLGGVAGGLLMFLPAGMHVKEGILFLTFILMVYYVRRNYAIAAFIITLNLVLLFNIESTFNNMLLATRAICTIGGALLAIASGFALLPTWDKKWLPTHLAGAIQCNYLYFTATFFSPSLANWTKFKRSAETGNSNVFDSFNRYMQEPGNTKSGVYYDLITHSIRITRNLNNIHIEQDEKKQPAGIATPAQRQRIMDCLAIFDDILKSLPLLDPDITSEPAAVSPHAASFLLNDAQLTALEKLFIELRSLQQDLQKLSR